MKTRSAFLAVLLVLIAASSTPALGQSFLAKRDNATAKDNRLAFPGKARSQIVLRSYDVTGDNADAALHITSGVTMTRLTGSAATTGATSTNLPVAATNIITAGQGLVVVQRADSTSTVHEFYSVGTGTITIAAGIGTAAAAGDQVWWCSHVATNVIGNATVRQNGALWAAQLRAPLALRLVSTSGTAEKINNAVVEYVASQ
jgi:hypothetical protein